MPKKVKLWFMATGMKVLKTMAETAIALIGSNTIGITDVDWVGLLSTCALSGIITILFNIQSLPDIKEDA